MPSFRNIDADVIGQNALHAGGLHPGNLFDFAAASVERNADYTAAAILVKRGENGFAGNDVVAGDFDLFRLEQQNFWRVKQKI